MFRDHSAGLTVLLFVLGAPAPWLPACLENPPGVIEEVGPAPNDPPTISFLQPENESTFTTDQTIEATMRAADDGPISEIRISVLSDVHGALFADLVPDDSGTVRVFISSLSAGRHILITRATDSEGLSHEHYLEIEVIAP